MLKGKDYRENRKVYIGASIVYWNPRDAHIPGAVNKMNEANRKEMAFYLMLGCVVLSLVTLWKTRNIFYFFAALGFGALVILAKKRQLQAAKKAAEVPTEQYLRGVRDAAFLRKR